MIAYMILGLIVAYATFALIMWALLIASKDE